MGTRAQWDALVTPLRESTDPFQEPAFAELWALACREAPLILWKFRRSNRLDDDRIADLTRDLLVGSLTSILDAANPHRYFSAALVNAALGWLRKGSSALAREDESELGASKAASPAPDHALRMDVSDYLRTLSDREYSALIGVAQGEDRKELARLLGITSANLDQLVSRARRRFPREEP